MPRACFVLSETDTWVQTILNNVTFRNFKASNTSRSSNQFAIRYMDHSDHFTPQVGHCRFSFFPRKIRKACAVRAQLFKWK